VRCLNFDFLEVFPILPNMSNPLVIKVCTGRACTERHSQYIEKRLFADREFYHFEDDVSIEQCLCQWRCKEWPTVVFWNDVQVGQNPVKSSEMLVKKIAEIRKRLQNKKPEWVK